MTTLAVTQHRFPTPSTTIATLGLAFDEQGTLQLSQPGTGSITVPRDSLVRVVTDGVRTNADATVTSATALFSSGDVGLPITGTGIPAGTTIASINSATSVEMSANATSSASGATLNIGYDLRINDLLRYKVDGTVRHASIVEQLEDHTLDAEGKARQVTSAIGGGIGAALGWGIVGPANGFGARPKAAEDRLFNVYSMAYDISGWDDAVLTGVAAIPAEWPTVGGPYGPYISTTSATGTETPNGPSFLGTDLTLGSDVEATMFCSADNWATVYLDERRELVVGGIDQANSYLRTYTARVSLTAGTHRIMVRNYNKGGDNPGGIRFLLASLNSNGHVDTVYLESSDDWKNLETPASKPGMTPGQAVLLVLDVIQARGRLTWLSVDFDEMLDSAGAAWSSTADITTKASGSFLEFLTELSATYVDWVVNPATLTLELYVKDTYAQVGAAAVTLEPAAVTAADGNVVELDRVRT